MSLSPFDSFQSRFVTYLLNRPRISIVNPAVPRQGCLTDVYQLQYLRSPSCPKEALTVGSERAAVIDLAVSDATPLIVMSTTT